MSQEEPDSPVQAERSTAAIVAAVLGAFIVATLGLLLLFELVEGNLF